MQKYKKEMNVQNVVGAYLRDAPLKKFSPADDTFYL